jgi:hypothetical protein
MYKSLPVVSYLTDADRVIEKLNADIEQCLVVVTRKQSFFEPTKITSYSNNLAIAAKKVHVIHTGDQREALETLMLTHFPETWTCSSPTNRPDQTGYSLLFFKKAFM